MSCSNIFYVFTIRKEKVHLWSETEYDGWQLTWSVGNFYDRLDKIDKDGIIYLYSYDGNGNRIS